MIQFNYDRFMKYRNKELGAMALARIDRTKSMILFSNWTSKSDVCIIIFDRNNFKFCSSKVLRETDLNQIAKYSVFKDWIYCIGFNGFGFKIQFK